MRDSFHVLAEVVALFGLISSTSGSQDLSVEHNQTAAVSSIGGATNQFSFWPDAVSDYQIYSADGLEGTRLSSGCRSALTKKIQCHEYTRSFRELQYRGPLENATLTPILCDPACGESLANYFINAQAACGGETLNNGPATLVVGRIWQGWNETCLMDPRTKEYCNDVIDRFPKVESVDKMSKEHACSFCWVRRHEMMRSPYSLYDSFYKGVLESINSICGLKKPTDIPPPLTKTPKRPDSTFCATAKSYTTVKGDTCSSIAEQRKFSSAALWMANQRLILNCNRIDAGIRLCLPESCERIYKVSEKDSCNLIEMRNNLPVGTVKRVNPWLDAVCSNLQSGIKNLGNVLCLSAPGGLFTSGPPAGLPTATGMRGG